jgi:3-oxoacyl-[acyl-carrier-protein] synthase II
MEGIAIRKFLGGRAGEVPVTASKGTLGHTLGSAGVLETLACVSMLEEGKVHPTANFEVEDPECGLRPVTEPMEADLRAVLKSAAGFGGQNAALVLKRV